jgi:hypothetical protein
MSSGVKISLNISELNSPSSESCTREIRAELAFVKIPPVSLIVAVIVSTPITSFANPSSPGPQHYLIFGVLTNDRYDVGTLSTATNHFQYTAQSRDGSDSIVMHAKLISKTSQGFRFAWSVVHRVHDKEIVHITERVFVPWGTTKSLKSIPGYHVSTFYSKTPAREDAHVIML